MIEFSHHKNILFGDCSNIWSMKSCICSTYAVHMSIYFWIQYVWQWTFLIFSWFFGCSTISSVMFSSNLLRKTFKKFLFYFQHLLNFFFKLFDLTGIQCSEYNFIWKLYVFHFAGIYQSKHLPKQIDNRSSILLIKSCSFASNCCRSSYHFESRYSLRCLYTKKKKCVLSSYSVSVCIENN